MMIVIWVVLSTVLVVAATAFVFTGRPAFGSLPRGERMERIARSPNFRDGQFRNRHETPLLTSGKSRLGTMLGFLLSRTEGLRPDTALPVVRTDLHKLRRDEDLVVWFGHSSCLIQTDGRRILVDPVFRKASPVAFVNRPFAGTDIYKPEDMPEIDYLVITHDHWDHLDFQTVTELKDRIGTVVCGLGVGAHFERWGFDPQRIIELDWDESAAFDDGLAVHCLPARHFSGRGLASNRSLWASFLWETPSRKIYLAGDGGYDTHFAEIGRRFPGIDLAVLENGQYNDDWRYIHLMPAYLLKAAKDLGARRVLTVHHSKYALARHRWDEPLKNADAMARDGSVDVIIPQIGQLVGLE